MSGASILPQYLRSQILIGIALALVFLYVGTFAALNSYYQFQIEAQIQKICESEPNKLVCEGDNRFELLYIDFHEPVSGYGKTTVPYFFKFSLNKNELSMEHVEFVPFNNNILLYKRRQMID